MKKFLFVLLFSIYSSSNIFALNLIALNSDQGGKMLSSSISTGYAKQFLSEVRYFTYQENIYFCSVATSAIILNTLNITPPDDNNFGKYKLFTQNNLFTSDITNKTGISASTIFGHGLTLTQETQLLNAFSGVKAVAYSTERITEIQAKNLIVGALKSNYQLVVANIFRNSMNESGGGHFSPVAAYDAKSDSVLFMDVAAFKYGPTWVPIKVLYNGMHTKDGDAYRGFILISKNVESSIIK